MNRGIQVSRQSDAPLYRQIARQMSFMIESGELGVGQNLPSARLLADNLHLNRNTVAHAYQELARLGLVESRGRGGTVVVGAGPAPVIPPRREQARAILGPAVRRCLDLGLTAAELQPLVAELAGRPADNLLAISFVECNEERAKYFAAELERHLGMNVRPLVLGEFDPADVPTDLALTTFFHLAEVRGQWRRPAVEVVAIVVAPHVRTLVRIASVPANRTVGIRYSTEEQAVSIRDSLTQSGITNIRVLHGTGDADLEDVDLVVVPSELPDLKEGLPGRVEVIEFGNVLDAASIRVVTEVVADMQAAKRAS